jgi:cation transport ATPase
MLTLCAIGDDSTRHRNYGMDLLVVLGTSTAYFYSLIALWHNCTKPSHSDSDAHMHMEMDNMASLLGTKLGEVSR